MIRIQLHEMAETHDDRSLQRDRNEAQKDNPVQDAPHRAEVQESDTTFPVQQLDRAPNVADLSCMDCRA